VQEYPIAQAAVSVHDAEDIRDGPHGKPFSSTGAVWTHTGVPPSWAAGVAKALTIPAQRNAFAKRALDIVFALLVLLVTLPFYPLILLLIRLDSAGPAFFRQVRAGRNGMPFVVYKFRSMHHSSQATDPLYQQIATSWLRGVPLSESLHGAASTAGNGAHSGREPGQFGSRDAMLMTGAANLGSGSRKTTTYKLKNDPRITRVGRVLRMTSIDELPQFINVLRGEMSLVGPRPAIPYEVDHYAPRDFGRLLVKPGVTGLWQVRGRGHVSFQQMIELDLVYVANNSFWQDVSLILRTIPAVLFASGAA